MKGKSNIFLAVIIIILTSQISLAQNSLISKKEIKTTIDSLSLIIKKHHIDPAVGEEMVNILNTNYKNGIYDTITNKSSFAKTLETDLSEVANDKHFHLYYDPENAKASVESGENETLNAMLGNPYDNFGFEEIRILPGNVGYW